mmetsp:Transcript_5460/g.8162  ORF Transcript_5460/g.8162 Transcript_5460/m.8162 type:complete len:232 (-) Transcript_5460:932-1627(-)
MPFSWVMHRNALRFWRRAEICLWHTLVPNCMVLRRHLRGLRLPLKPTVDLSKDSWRMLICPMEMLDAFFSHPLPSSRRPTGQPRRLSRPPWKTTRVLGMKKMNKRHRMPPRISILVLIGTMKIMVPMNLNRADWKTPWMILTLVMMMISVTGMMIWILVMIWLSQKNPWMKWRVFRIWEMDPDLPCPKLVVPQLPVGLPTVRMLPCTWLLEIPPSRCSFSIDRLLSAISRF